MLCKNLKSITILDNSHRHDLIWLVKESLSVEHIVKIFKRFIYYLSNLSKKTGWHQKA